MLEVSQRERNANPFQHQVASLSDIINVILLASILAAEFGHLLLNTQNVAEYFIETFIPSQICKFCYLLG